MARIAVVNTKGGASKSTVAFQICSAYLLSKNLEFVHYELDDENRDAEVFGKSKIVRKQIHVGDGSDLTEVVRKLVVSEKNFVVDVGGNKTTSMFLDALRKSRMYRLIDLFVISSSGGSQDIENAIRTYKRVKEMHKGAKVLFALSRVRNPKRVKFQYARFFESEEIDPADKKNFILLKDSDVVDLSRNLQKSIYEIVQDVETKKSLESAFDKAVLSGDEERIEKMSVVLEILDEAEEFFEKYVKIAFRKLDEILNPKEGGEK